MGTETAALAVALTAKLDAFEAKLKEAGVLGDRQAQEIEDRFNRVNPTISTAGLAAATGVGALLAKGFESALSALGELIDRMKTLPDEAKLIGTSVQDLFALQQVVGQATGLSPDETNRGLDALATKLNDARRQANDLSELFDANGRKIKDAAGNAIPLQEALGTVADLVRNAATELDKVKIAEIAGLSRDWVKALEGGGPALGAARDAAAAAAPDLQKLIDQANEFDAAWRSVADNLKTYLKSAASEALAALKPLATDVLDRLQTGIGMLRILSGERLAAVEQGDKPTPLPGLTANPPPRPTTPTVIPTKGGGGGSSGPDPDRFFENQLRRTNDRAEDLDLETRSLGLNTEARVRARAALDLEQAARRGGIQLTEEQRQKLDEASAALGRNTAAFELARQKQAQFLQLQNFGGNLLVDAIDAATQKGTKLADVFANVAQAIGRAALQAAILGQGPLAGLFGSAATPGSSFSGGLIGGLAKLVSGIGANAEGTDNWRGGLSWVGERGPELVNLPRGAQVVPNDVLRKGGTGATSIALTIDVRGATGNQEIQSMIAAGVQAGMSAVVKQVPGIANAVVRDRGRAW